jgi:glycosyltransferase involved in cell wall biosynthesis
VLAIQLAVERMGLRSPTFHLEFRHAPFERDAVSQDPIESPQTQMERRFFALQANWEPTERICFYTDSERLSRDYETIADVPFGVLPLPFRAELLTSTSRQTGEPVTLVYLGEARDEKGFHWLPDLIEALTDDYLMPGKARLLIQSNVGQPQHNSRTMAALLRLRSQPRPGVELVANDALSPSEYYRLASQADVMLLPYLRERYRACTSGVLAEALATGAAAVVPAGTWMADKLPPGCGETFTDLEGFISAVKRVVDSFPSYRAAAKASQSEWRRRHSPDALLARLLGREALAKAA